MTMDPQSVNVVNSFHLHDAIFVLDNYLHNADLRLRLLVFIELRQRAGELRRLRHLIEQYEQHLRV